MGKSVLLDVPRRSPASRKLAKVAVAPTPTSEPAARVNWLDELHRHQPLLWVLFGLFAVVSLCLLGLRTLVPPDEGRYAEMAREMWVSGDWITTRLNGIKYFEKPPLQTWMNALTFAAFGLGDWQARLWTGLCGLLGVLLVWYSGLRVFGARVGLYAALALGASLFWVAASQINSLDMSLSGMTTLALCALLLAQRDDASVAERRRWMLVCWAGMALAVLAKGLIGVVLPGAVLVLYTLVTRDLALWRRLHMGPGLLVFFAIATPWFVLVALRNPEQPHFFFIHEHWDRFLHDDHHRVGKWHYFIPGLLAGITPWLGLLPHSLLGAVRRRPGVFQPQWMLLIWACFIFMFFSYSSSKLPGYIVPIFPALAMLVGLCLATATPRQRQVAAWVVMVFGAVALALVPRLARFSSRPGEEGLLLAFQPYIVALGLVSLVGGLIALLLAGRDTRRDVGVLVMALTGFISTQLILAGFEPYGHHRAALALVPAMQAELTPASTIYSVGTYEQSLPFYLQRTMTLVAYTDEFTFGLEQQPALTIPTLEQFARIWSAHAAAGVHDVALMQEDAYRELQRRGVAMRLVTQDTRRIVVANR